MKDIAKQPPIEWGGQIVITTAQLAQAYGTTAKNVTKNFNRNKERFEVGKHYFALQGDELKEFMRVVPERCLPPSTSIAYLWTRRGASRHCKILGTDKAWEQFDYLEDNYFDREKQQTPPQTLQSQIRTIAQGTDELYQRVEGVEGRIQDLENTMNLDHGQQRQLEKAVNKTVISVLGGKESNAYKAIGRKVFCECNGNLKDYFKVNARGDVPRKRYEEALAYAEKWRPCINTQMLIEQYNAQQSLDLDGDKNKT